MDFWKDIIENEELKDELLQTLKNANIDSEAAKIDAILEFAKKKGYEVFEEDAELAKAKIVNTELSDDELIKISGGATDQEMLQWCAGDYLCNAVWNSCNVSNECYDGLWKCKEAMAHGNCTRGFMATQACSGVFWGKSSDCITARSGAD